MSGSDYISPTVPEEVKERAEELFERYRGYPSQSFQETMSELLDLAEQRVEKENQSGDNQ